MSAEWGRYEDVRPFVLAQEIEASVIEELGGETDGRRTVVLEVCGPVDFAGPQTVIRVLLDRVSIDYLVTALTQAMKLFPKEEN